MTRAAGWYARDLEKARMARRRRRALLPTCCVRGCEIKRAHKGLIPLDGKLFCQRHARLWAEHYRIIERIRSL